MSILFLSKRTDWCRVARDFVAKHGRDVTILDGDRTTPLPEAAAEWHGDYIISFLSPWIVPPGVLDRATRAAVNFHPGPPEYPGIGCYNFALYDGAQDYGVTCHHMDARVDAGAIIDVRRFPLFDSDDVGSLQTRSMAHLLAMLLDVGSLIVREAALPLSSEKWRRRPSTRSELDALCKITPDMSDAEIRRRIRATYYPGHPGPYVELAGQRFPAL